MYRNPAVYPGIFGETGGEIVSSAMISSCFHTHENKKHGGWLNKFYYILREKLWNNENV